jgi:cytochrome P450
MSHFFLTSDPLGTDTSSTTIAWTTLLVTKYSHGNHYSPISNKHFTVQDKIHEEIKQSSEPEMSKLPYLQAVLKESFRFRVPGPLSIPHVVDEQVELAGYTIPKDTIIFHNVWACNFNEKDWKSPEIFRFIVFFSFV